MLFIAILTRVFIFDFGSKNTHYEGASILKLNNLLAGCLFKDLIKNKMSSERKIAVLTINRLSIMKFLGNVIDCYLLKSWLFVFSHEQLFVNLISILQHSRGP